MPHVMKTRLETSSIAALHVGPTTQLVKNSVCRSSCNRIPVTADEEWSIQPARMRFASLIGIGRKYVDKIWAKRYESCLVELALPNLDQADGQIYIIQCERQCLTDTQPCSV